MVDWSHGPLRLFEGFNQYHLRVDLMHQPLIKFNKVCILASMYVLCRLLVYGIVVRSGIEIAVGLSY